jgi:hypothetical protein
MSSLVASVIDVASAIEDEEEQNVYVNNQCFISGESIKELSKKKVVITESNELNTDRIRGEDGANVMIYFTGYQKPSFIIEMFRKIPKTIDTLLIDGYGIFNTWMYIPKHIENVIVFEGEKTKIIEHKMDYLDYSSDRVHRNLFNECYEESRRNSMVNRFTPFLMQYGSIDQVEEMFEMIDVSKLYLGDVNLLTVFIARQIRNISIEQTEMEKINGLLEKFIDRMTNEQLIEVREIEVLNTNFNREIVEIMQSIFMNMCSYFNTDDRLIMKVIDRLTNEELKKVQERKMYVDNKTIIEMLQERGFENAMRFMMEKLG